MQDEAVRAGGIECGGILVGQWCADEGDGLAFVKVDHAVPATDLGASALEFRLAPETFGAVQEQIHNEWGGSRIVGWSHSHPGPLGTEMSYMDTFSHRHFFRAPWQVAVIVDPAAGELGAYRWVSGAIERIPGYWSLES